MPSHELIPRRGLTEERAFVTAIATNPQDETSRLVFADWLDEHGRGEEARLLRTPSTTAVITPFRIVPHWGAYRSGRTIVFVRTADASLPTDQQIQLAYPGRDSRAANLLARLEAHRLACHHHRLSPGQAPHPGVLVLCDEEALVAGIDRLPLAPEEPAPFITPPGRPVLPEVHATPRR